MTETNIKFFIDKAVGLSIVHLRSIYTNNDITVPYSPMDYHLHMMLYYNDEIKSAGVLCLDNMDIQTFPCPDRKYLRDAVREIYIHLTKVFIDRVASAITAKKIEENIIFDKAPQELWDKFNDIKQKTFIQGVKDNSNYIPKIKTEKNNFIDDTLEKPDEIYNWAKIRLAEERISQQSLEVNTSL